MLCCEVFRERHASETEQLRVMDICLNKCSARYSVLNRCAQYAWY